MLTPSRKSRRSILTPVRSNSRNASPAPLIEKPQIISETPQYQLLSVPHSTHALARDALRRKHVTAGGVRGAHAWITEGNRVIVWPVGGVRVFELPLPSPALSVHLLEDGLAIVVTVKGEVIRWKNVEQCQRYSVLQDSIPVQVVHSIVSEGTVLVLDADFGLWGSEGDRMVKRAQASAIQGISRRVSSMFWSDPTSQLGSALKVVEVGEHVFCVGTQGIQRTHNNNALWTAPLAPLISDIFSRDDITIIPQSVCVRDAICSEESLVGLATVSSSSENLHIFIFYLNSISIPDKVDGLIDLEVEGEGDFTDLLIIDNCEKGYVYSKSNVSSIDLSTGSVLDLQLPPCSDIIALGSLNDRNVVFTKQGGMMKIIMKDVKEAVSTLNIVEEDLLSVVEKKLHGAFKCFLEFNETQDQAKLEDILGCDDSAVICKIVYDTAKYLLTAAPAADPRWGGDGADLPVTIGYQIDERCRRLKGLVLFMQRTSYWSTLCDNNVEGVCVAGYLLQCVEQVLVGAVFYANHSELLARAVKQCASARTDNENSHLSPEDIFYSQLQCVEELFKCLAQHQNSALREQQQMEGTVQEMYSSVKVVQEALDTAYHYREDNKHIYQAAQSVSPYTWLDTDEMRTIAAAQYSIAMDSVLPEINDEGRYQVLVVCASLAESLLTGYSTLISLLPPADNHTAALVTEYERRRHALITPFVELKVYQIAFSLCEQFQYFTLLVQLCEETGDVNKLKALSNKHEGFAEVAYQWYLEHGKQSRLLTSGLAEPAQLTKFLAPHSHLSWIHHLGRKDYTQAGQALKSLGEGEKDLLSRKKTLLSIGKLALLAGGCEAESEDIATINRELETVTFQERMKPEIIENAGLDPERMAPVQTSDLITMCIGSANPHLEDIDIKKALDLLHALAEDENVSNEEFEKMRLDIWVAAISKDEWWKQCTLSSPEHMDSTLFYRAVILAYNSGLMISSLIPPVDQLLAVPTWGEVFSTAQHKQFQYLLRSGYEQMAQLGVMG